MGPEHDPQADAQRQLATDPLAPTASPVAATPLAALLRGAAASSLTPQHVMALQRGAGNASVAGLLRQLAPPAVEPGVTAAGLLVADDGPAPPPGRVRLSEFLDHVEREVSSVAERELSASVYTAAGCPWIAHWIGYYRGRPPGEVEAAIRRYAPAIAAAGTVDAQVAAIGARVSEGIRVWSQTGAVPQPPPDSPGAPPGWQADVQPAAGVARTPAGEAAAERARLGPGRPLDGSVSTRMGGALGADLSRVRVHADDAGAALATRRGALATAVGEHVAFAPGAYAPGTPVGDALLAHELAHTVQQAGAADGVLAAERAAEADADHAAVGALAALWGGTGELARRLARNARPTLRSGLALRSCPAPSSGVTAPKEVWVRASGTPGFMLPSDMRAAPDEAGKASPQGARFQFDSDGDQRPDMDALIRLNRPAGGKATAHVELTQWASKHTAVADLDLPNLGDPLDPPVIDEVTDGLHPTEFGITTGLAVRVTPRQHMGQFGSSASVQIAERRIHIGDGLVTPQLVTFPPGGEADGAVFSTAPSPLEPQGKESTLETIGDVWKLDVAVGAFGDRFRLSFSAHDAGQVTFGIGVLSDEGPVAGYGGTIALQRRGQPPKILSHAGASLTVDLDGDGVADLTLYDRLTVPTQEQLDQDPQVDETTKSLRSPALHRDHHITVDGPRLGGPLTFHFPVRSGMIMAGTVGGTAVDYTAASDLRAATGLQEQQKVGTVKDAQGRETLGQVAGELAQIDKTLGALRQQAFEDKLISAELFKAWLNLAGDFNVLAAFEGAPADAPKLLQFKAGLLQHAQTFYDELYKATPTKLTSASKYSSTSENEYTGDVFKSTAGAPTHPTAPGKDFAAQITKGDWPAATKSYRKLENGLDRWIAHRNRETHDDPDLTKPETMRGVLGENLAAQREQLEGLKAHNPTRVAAVLHPREPWEDTGKIAEAPVSLYFWKQDGYWKFKDVTNPKDTDTWAVPVHPTHAQLAEPPEEAFKVLDEDDHFPAGVIHYMLPSGRSGQLTTTGPSSLRKWAGIVGGAAAAVGLGLVTFGAGTVAVVGAYVLAGGAALGAILAADDLLERARHDRLTTNAVILDVLQIATALTAPVLARAGQLVSGARAAAGAGEMVEATVALQWANRWYMPLQTFHVANDVTTYIVMTDELFKQIRAIRDSGAPPDQQANAMMGLLGQYAVTTGLTVLNVKGALPEIAPGAKMGIAHYNGVDVMVPAGVSPTGAALNKARLKLGGAPSDIQAHLSEIRAQMPGDPGDVVSRVEAMALRPATDGNIQASRSGEITRDGAPGGTLNDLYGTVAKANNIAAAHGLDVDYRVVLDPVAPGGSTPVRVVAEGRTTPRGEAATARQVVAGAQGSMAGAARLAQEIHALSPGVSVEVLPSGALRVAGAPEFDAVKLIQEFNGNLTQASELVHRLGASVTRLASDATGPELLQLIATYDAPSVRWAGTQLNSADAGALLARMTPRIRQWVTMRQPALQPAPTTLRPIVEVMESPRLEAALSRGVQPPEFGPLVAQESPQVAREVFDQGAANPAQWGRFRARLANIGAAVAPGGELAGAPGALAADAIVADSNTIIALRSLIAGRAVWHGTAGPGQTTLARNERAAITRLRQLTGQLPPAAPHTGTAPVAEVDTVPLQPTVAEAQALLNRVANTNVGMMELGPGAPGQPGRGTAFGIDVDRASPEYAAMLTELAVPPQQPWKKGKSSAALGKGGVRDHGMLADALFATRASPTDIPVFLTVDDDVFVRLSGFAEKSGSGFVDFRMPAKPQPGFKEARLLAATNPQGYTILVRGQRLRVVYGTP